VDPAPAFQWNADPDPALKMNADQDPCNKLKKKIFFKDN
jgi:hypothetical protein